MPRSWGGQTYSSAKGSYKSQVSKPVSTPPMRPSNGR